MKLKPDIKKKIKTAIAKAKEVNSKIAKVDGTISIKSIETVVKCMTEKEIRIYPLSFKELFDEDVEKQNVGAMMKTVETENTAIIFINSDNNELVQRFSIVHEMGHLITNAPNYTDGKNYTLSTHINSDITFISNESLNEREDEFLINEQVANVFALMVLIPQKITIKDIAEIGCTELSKIYGVTKEAIMSRMVLGLENDE